MAVNTNPLQNSPVRAFALQKYLLLHSQHDALAKHLSSITSIDAEDDDDDDYNSAPYFNSRYAFDSPSSRTSSSISPISETSSVDDISLQHHHQQQQQHTSPGPSRPSLGRPRRSSLPATMSTLPASIARRDAEIDDEERKLVNVNQQIKTVLTELLNCEEIRGDRRYRSWIQQRLMDAERELKGCRSRSCTRRRSSAMSPENSVV